MAECFHPMNVMPLVLIVSFLVGVLGFACGYETAQK